MLAVFPAECTTYVCQPDERLIGMRGGACDTELLRGMFDALRFVMGGQGENKAHDGFSVTLDDVCNTKMNYVTQYNNYVID